MTLHPEDLRYWAGWLLWTAIVLGVVRLCLIQPIVRELRLLRAAVAEQR